MENILNAIFVVLHLHQDYQANGAVSLQRLLVSSLCLVGQYLTKNNFQAKYATRQKSNTVWIYGCFMVPIILSQSTLNSNPDVLQLSTSLGLLTILIHTLISCVSFKLKCLICSLIMFDQIVRFNFLILITSYLDAYIIYTYLVIILHLEAGTSLSTGEIIVLSQLITYMFNFNMHNTNNTTQDTFDYIRFSSCISGVMITLLLPFIGLCYITGCRYRNFMFYSYLIGVVAFIYYNHARIFSLLYFILNFFIFDLLRFQLLVYWLFTCFLCIIYTVFHSKSNNEISTAERKFFHAFILLVFIPGLVYDVLLLYVSSAIGVCVFIILCVIDAYKLEPFGERLHFILIPFKGQQDTGKFTLTPVFLFVGLSLPIWLSLSSGNDRTIASLQCYSGVLSVGIGDAFASIAGSKWGKNKFPGTSKTVEGFFASVCSQVLSLYMLVYFNCVTFNISRLYITVVITLTSLIEVYTKEIDNLILPIIMYSLLI
ncbi:uncharacterized protein LOC104266616 [Ciona intestinalis]